MTMATRPPAYTSRFDVDDERGQCCTLTPRIAQLEISHQDSSQRRRYSSAVVASAPNRVRTVRENRSRGRILYSPYTDSCRPCQRRRRRLNVGNTTKAGGKARAKLHLSLSLAPFLCSRTHNLHCPSEKTQKQLDKRLRCVGPHTVR